MTDLYSDMMDNMQFFLDKKDTGYTIPLFPRLNKVLGNINPGTFTTVAGTPSSGRTSFVDSVYVMNVLLQWYNSDNRKPLKIFYFSLKDEKLTKLQQLLCIYLMAIDNIRIDLPTLNSQPGRLFDMNDRPDVIEAIRDAGVFFKTIEEEGVLTILSGNKSPSEVIVPVVDYLREVGDDDKEGDYTIEEGLKDGTVMVVVDSTDSLIAEYEGYGRVTKHELSNKLIEYAELLKSRYNVNVIVVTSTERGIIRHPSDTKPILKHLGPFANKCDKGIVLYNPIAENALRFCIPNGVDTHYVSAGRNTLRLWYVVRNTNGADSVNDRFLMLPGSGYMVEYPIETPVSKFEDIYDELMEDREIYLPADI